MTQDIQEEEAGKLFVGGLSWETTKEKLNDYFARFGEIADCVVMKNSETGRSRGFGFVTFKDPTCVQLVLKAGPHHLDDRTIDPKSCNPKSVQRTKREAKLANNPKVFLGGLPSDVNETVLRQFFSEYGKVIEVVIMYDQERKKTRGNGFRGFGFLSFESEEAVDKVVAEHFVIIRGKKVEVKRAEPREKSAQNGLKNVGNGSTQSSEVTNGIPTNNSWWSQPSNPLPGTPLPSPNQVRMATPVPPTSGIMQPSPYPMWNPIPNWLPPPPPPIIGSTVSPARASGQSAPPSSISLYVKSLEASATPASALPPIPPQTDPTSFIQTNGWSGPMPPVYPSYPTWSPPSYHYPMVPATPPPPHPQLWPNQPYAYGSSYPIGYGHGYATVPMNSPPVSLSVPHPMHASMPPPPLVTTAHGASISQHSIPPTTHISTSSQSTDSNYGQDSHKYGPTRLHGFGNNPVNVKKADNLPPECHYDSSTGPSSGTNHTRSSATQPYHPYRRA